MLSAKLARRARPPLGVCQPQGSFSPLTSVVDRITSLLGSSTLAGAFAPRSATAIASASRAAASRENSDFMGASTSKWGQGPAAGASRTPFNRSYLLRGTVLWQPTGQFDARLKATWSDDRTVGSPFQLVSCPDGVGPVPPGNVPYINPAETCRRDRTLYTVDRDFRRFPFLDVRDPFA